MTTIQWTDETWNPTRGCSLVSPGCSNCYAMRQAHRFSGKGGKYEGLTKARKNLGPVWTGRGRLVVDMLAKPLHWKKPRRVFVNSMSDLFHERLTNEEIAAVFGVMAACPQHTFQILTKRATRMREWFEWVGSRCQGEADHCVSCAEDQLGPPFDDDFSSVAWPLPNVHLGVSAEDQERADERIPELLRTPAAIRWVSYEPALGPVDFSTFMSPGYAASQGGQDSFDGLDWIVVGGESGPGARPFDVAWARSVIEQCKDAGVRCFVKQLGTKPYRMFHEQKYPHDPARWHAQIVQPLRLKDRAGGDMSEWPEDLRIREWPKVRG